MPESAVNTYNTNTDFSTAASYGFQDNLDSGKKYVGDTKTKMEEAKTKLSAGDPATMIEYQLKTNEYTMSISIINQLNKALKDLCDMIIRNIS